MTRPVVFAPVRSGTTVHASASNVSRGGFIALAVSTVIAVIVISVGQSSTDLPNGTEIAADQLAASTSQTADVDGSTESSASSLLDDVDGAQLFEAGARDDLPSDEAEAVQADTASTAAGDLAPDRASHSGAESADEESASTGGTTAGGASATAEAQVGTRPAPAPQGPTVTNAPSTTAAPATDAPTTAAPTTAAPTTAAPTTAAPTTAAPTTAAPTTEPPPPPTPSTTTPTDNGAPTAEQWAALRQCESGGRYDVVSANGLYHGAYQFAQSTWNGVARSAGRSDLDGVAPSKADPADQDAMALVLWTQRGNQPWPVCGKHIPPKP